jgi:hypothetical protein
MNDCCNPSRDNARDALKYAQDLAKTIIDPQGAIEILPTQGHDKSYVYDLDAVDAEHARSALDLLSRIHLGQYYAIKDVLVLPKLDSYEAWHNLEDMLRYVCKKVTGLHGNGSWGIHNKENVSDEARVSWDLAQVVRGAIAWDRNPRGGITVDFDVPRQSSMQTLPKIEVSPKVESAAGSVQDHQLPTANF